MMNEISIRMLQDLKLKLDLLCFIHDQPKLHMVNEFFRLRSSIDIDAEEMLARFTEAKLDDEAEEVVKTNVTRLEFIRILRELEERCLNQLPQASNTSSNEVYGDFQNRIDQLQACPEDQLEDAYVQLAFELLDETYKLEWRLLCEQTILYLSSNDKNQLGNLIYIGEDRLRAHEIKCIKFLSSHPKADLNLSVKIGDSDMLSLCTDMMFYSTIVDKNYMIASRLIYYFESTPSTSKFIYMGKDAEEQYKGYFLKNARIETEFVSYRFPIENDKFKFRFASFIPSLDVLDCFLPDKCQLDLFECRLNDQDILSFSFAARLTHLHLHFCNIEHIVENLLARCNNLELLSIDSRTLSMLRFDSEKLAPVALSLRNVIVHGLEDPFFKLPSLANLVNLDVLVLGGNIEDNPLTSTMFTEDEFKSLAEIPRLTRLILSNCMINSVGAYAFADFKNLKHIHFPECNIGHVHEKAFLRKNGETIKHSGI